MLLIPSREPMPQFNPKTTASGLEPPKKHRSHAEITQRISKPGEPNDPDAESFHACFEIGFAGNVSTSFLLVLLFKNSHQFCYTRNGLDCSCISMSTTRLLSRGSQRCHMTQHCSILKSVKDSGLPWLSRP